ncbi:MAG: copper chaperone PCu(A)C [Dongiaceae bacterium]
MLLVTAAFCPALAKNDCAVQAGDLQISQAYAIDDATPGRLRVYMTIYNGGFFDDYIRAAASPLGTAELRDERGLDHRALLDQPVMEIPLRAGQLRELKPQGYYILLEELEENLGIGERFSLALRFRLAGETTMPITYLGRDPEKYRDKICP